MRKSDARRAAVLLLAALTLLPAACTRRFYRKSTDIEAEQVITEKNVYPSWGVEQWHVYPDCRARFADFSDPDHPPMPCDDPAAERISPNPQKPGKAGSGGWEGLGYLEILAQWDAVVHSVRILSLPTPSFFLPQNR